MSSGWTPFDYEESVRKELHRRAEAVTAYCDELLERLHREDADTPSTASQGRLRRLVSFMVKYIRTHPAVGREFQRLVNLDTSTFVSKEGLRLCEDIERTLLEALEHMRKQYHSISPDRELKLRWDRVGDEIGLLEIIDREEKKLHGALSPDPEVRLGQEYSRVVTHLNMMRGELGLNEDERVAKWLSSYSDYMKRLEHLVDYGVDYAGGRVAQVLARIHFDIDSDDATDLFDNDLKPLKYWGENMLGATDAPTIEGIRSAAAEVFALLDAYLDGLAARGFLMDRLAAYLHLYKGPQVHGGAQALLRNRSSRVEEKVFQPIVNEYLFAHGYYPLSEAQLGHDRIRPDILSLAPQRDAWFLYELKQIGFGKEKASTRRVESKLQEAIRKAATYYERLAVLGGVQPDVYVLCFVNGTAEFTDTNGMRIGPWHTAQRRGVSLHVRLINVPIPRKMPPEFLVRTTVLDEA